MFNTVVFQGKEAIKPEELLEQDSEISDIIEFQGGEYGIERTRDVMKLSKNGARFLLLGVENQTLVHYGMPLKSLVYDVLGYINEAKKLSDVRKKEKGLTGAEFLSGMRKGDKLNPIITIVIYYGEEPWDGPLTLSEMLKETVQGSSFHQTEHRLILLQVKESEEFIFRNEENQAVFSISRDLFNGNLANVRREYGTKDLSSEIVRMIETITGIRNINEESQKEEINMCKAFDALLEKERQEGVNQACKGFKKILEKERKDAEERATKELQKQIEKERKDAEERGIKIIMEIMEEFKYEEEIICRCVAEKYGISMEDIDRIILD